MFSSRHAIVAAASCARLLLQSNLRHNYLCVFVKMKR